MSEYESLRADIEGVAASVANYALAVTHHAQEADRQIQLLWADNAELRDELHALANRVETLTRARLTEPAEVAERMIFTCRLNPGCNVSRPHVHQEDGALIYVPDEEAADTYLAQRAERDAILAADRRKS